MKREICSVAVGIVMLCMQAFGADPYYGAPVNMPGIPATNYPVAEFADWDGDGDDDMLLGQIANQGAVSLYTNSAGQGKTPVLTFKEFMKADGKQISLPSP